MKKELWAHISIAVHPQKKGQPKNGFYPTNYHHWHVIKSWEYPRWIIDRHGWFFRYVLALVQSRFPKHNVSFRYSGFYPQTREKMNSQRQQKIGAAKAQVTKVETAIDQFISERSKTLFYDYESDPIYRKLQHKLEEKKFNLQQAILTPIDEIL